MSFDFFDEVEVIHGFFKGQMGRVINVRTAQGHGTLVFAEYEVEAWRNIWVPGNSLKMIKKAPKTK